MCSDAKCGHSKTNGVTINYVETERRLPADHKIGWVNGIDANLIVEVDNKLQGTQADHGTVCR